MPFDRMLGYCADLRDHNDRTWFHENHRRYEEAKKDFLALLDQLRYVIAEASPEIGGDILYMDARDWVYRIARDMRFYKNVPPYNPSFRAYISADAVHQAEWEAILEGGQLTLEGDTLKTIPRGYAPDHPAAKWLRYKNWLVTQHFPDGALGSFDDFSAAIGALVPRMEPFRKFLLAAALSAESPKPILPAGEKDWGW